MKEHGHVEIIGAWGELATHATVSCCHCRAHWVYRPGSGRTRGWCVLCHAMTCGAPACDACVPFEQRLENVEAGRPELAPRPEMVLVPELPGAG